MVEGPNSKIREQVRKWVKEEFVNKRGSGVKDTGAIDLINYFTDKEITNVKKAKEHVLKNLKEGNKLTYNNQKRELQKRSYKAIINNWGLHDDIKDLLNLEKAEAKARIEADKAKGKDGSEPPADRTGEPSRPKSISPTPSGGGGQQGSNSVLFLLILSIILAVVDYFILRFGGLDYNVYLNAWKSGGLKLLIMTFFPIYVLAVLLLWELKDIAEAKNTKWFFFFIFVFLLAAKMITAYWGIDIVPVVGLPITIVALMAAMIVSVKFINPEYRIRFYSKFALIGIGSAILSLGGLFSIGGILHLGIAFLFRQYIINRPIKGGEVHANFLVALLLAFDFFGYGLIKILIPTIPGGVAVVNRYIFPVWFLYAWVCSLEGNQKKLTKVIAWSVFIFYIVTLVDATYGWTTIPAQMQAHPEEFAEAKSFFQDGFAKIKAFPGKIVEEYKKGMTEATGGYYQGKVEENQDPRNELGVNIDNLEAADKQFYQNEEVVVWGDLKAKTLDKPVYIYMSCEADGVKGKIVPDKLANPEYLNDPKKGYEIERLEEIPFECRFIGGQLKAGTNSIKVKAEFNFETLGYLKTYFIDIERMRALRKDNIDPLRQYGIDEKPKAIYTNGPVKLGMGTVDPPVGLSTTKDGYSYIGVTVQPQWNGRIKNITNLTIQVPKDLEIEKDGDFYCRSDFEMKEEDMEGYSVYLMREEEIKKIKTPIDAYKSWRCSISIPAGKTSEILGNTPVAIYYYRASVDYIYEIEKSTSVYVKAVPGEKRVLLDCETVCDDGDGCICNNEDDKCGVPKGETIGKGYTCNNAPIGSNRLRGYERTISDIDDSIEFIDSYIVLNELCAEGQTNETKISASLKAKGYKVDEETLKSIQKLSEECQYKDNKIGYIESGENKIVNKITDVVKIFENAKVNLKTDLEDPAKKEQLNGKKSAFIVKIDEVKRRFEIISKYMEDNYQLGIIDTRYHEAIDKAKADLEGITY